LSLGNSGGVQVHADGNEIDLAQFRRGNVAHLKLFGSAAALAERAQP
ncbi:MAG: DUF4115 domain-containing protein, partial [Rhodanobacteraceae bacterium]|nr:DUF4115 domain-containing protein [Rhodanobacteraceae bacterium]